MARRMTSPVLVGRDDALDVLRGALAAATRGSPRHVLVGGEAGMGKTRLLRRFAEIAAADGTRVLIGGCVGVGDSGLPFAPYTEILRTLVAEEGAVELAALAGRASADLARLLPAIGSEEHAPTQELWAETRLHEALLGLFERLARRAPALVGLEDLHWADTATLTATSFLLRAVRDRPLLLVGTFRSDEVVRTHPLRPWLAEVGRADRVDRLDLDPLSEADVSALVRNIVGSAPAHGTIVDLYRRTDGNPFFVEEILASPDYGVAALPSSLRDVLLARVDRLSQAARDVLDVAAIGGQEVEHDLLVGVAGVEPSTAGQALRELVDASLLVPARLEGHDGYGFRHALVREAVLDTLLPTEIRRLHAAFAGAMVARTLEAEMGSRQLVELAHHWREARDPRALEASIRAGDAAMAATAFDAALHEYEHSLRLWQERTAAASGIDHVGLLDRAATAAYLGSHYRRAVDLRHEALAQLGPDADPARRSELLVRLGRILWVSGDYAASMEAYEDGLRTAPPGISVARARALAGLAQVTMLFSWYSRSVPLAQEAIDQARALGARDLEGHALNTYGTDIASMGRVDEGLSALDAALAIAEELGLPDDFGRAHVNRGDVIAYAGYPDRALEVTRAAIDAVTERGMGLSYGKYLGHGAVEYAFQCGAWEEARELLARADRQGSDSTGTRLYRALYVLPYLVASGSDGIDEAWELARSRYRTPPPNGSAGLAYAAGVEHAAYAERHSEAVGIAWEGLDIVDRTDGGLPASVLARAAAWPLAEAAILARAAGDDAGIDAHLRGFERLVETVDRARSYLGDPPGRLGRVIDLVATQVLAERQRAEGRSEAGRWRGLREGWAEIGQPYRSLYAAWRLAEALDAADDRAAATSALRETHDAAERLGARPLAGRLEGLARRMRVRLGPREDASATGPPSNAFGLTPREHEVLARVALGRTNRQIAGELFISESTAGVHVSNILSKLGVSTRTEAARIALSQGLVEA